MTRVDFYVLPGEDPAARFALICRLAEKAYQQAQAVFIHGEDDAVLDHLDQLLWSFRATAFVPHVHLSKGELISAADSDVVQLSSGEPGPDRNVLINLGEQVPAFFSRFERTLEVVDQSADIRDAGRERYRFYQHRGYPLKHHRL